MAMKLDVDPVSLDLATLRRLFGAGELTVAQLAQTVLRRIQQRGEDGVWISRVPDETVLQRARELDDRAKQNPQLLTSLPLFGIPFAVKDNIDVLGMQTTAACPAFAYAAVESAYAIEKLLDAGAILIGKTNLDQFATGLVGIRSPYGIPRNPFNPEYIPGGSSSGSAVAVAVGVVSFALGTDTAGSGRVPAAFNNIVGMKPTRGLVSCRGVLPASRTLDCVSVFALTAADAAAILRVIAHHDEADPYSRKPDAKFSGIDFLSHKPHFRFAVPRAENLEFFGNRDAEQLYTAFINRLIGLGGEKIVADFSPFLEAAQLLYGGPWLAERYLSIKDFIRDKPQTLHPVTLEIIKKGADFGAVEVFAAIHRLQQLKHQAMPVIDAVDVLVTPTTGTIYRVAEVQVDPIRLNSNLGYYTNFMNIMDLSAVAIPAGFQTNGLPFGVTLFGRAFSDFSLLGFAAKIQRITGLTLGATPCSLPAEVSVDTVVPEGYVKIAVCGAHMSGLPLNHQLTQRGAYLWQSTRTAPLYRFYVLPGEGIKRPGLVRSENGAAIDLEIWVLPMQELGSFVASIPAPLGIGTLTIESGDSVQGFICEAYATANAVDITSMASWRAYLGNNG